MPSLRERLLRVLVHEGYFFIASVNNYWVLHKPNVKAQYYLAPRGSVRVGPTLGGSQPLFDVRENTERWLAEREAKIKSADHSVLGAAPETLKTAVRHLAALSDIERTQFGAAMADALRKVNDGLDEAVAEACRQIIRLPTRQKM